MTKNNKWIGWTSQIAVSAAALALTGISFEEWTDLNLTKINPIYNPSTWDYSNVGQTVLQRQNTFTSINKAFLMTLVIFEVPFIRLTALWQFLASRVIVGHAIYNPSFTAVVIAAIPIIYRVTTAFTNMPHPSIFRLAQLLQILQSCQSVSEGTIHFSLLLLNFLSYFLPFNFLIPSALLLFYPLHLYFKIIIYTYCFKSTQTQMIFGGNIFWKKKKRIKDIIQ